MIQVNRIYLIFNRLVTKKFLVDTSDKQSIISLTYGIKTGSNSKNFKLLCISPAKLFLIDKRRFNYFYLKHCIE